MPQRVILSGGTVVLPSSVAEPASVIIEEGLIAAVEPQIYRQGTSGIETVLDVAGHFVLPGLVDLHNDALEAEINPRPKSNLPLDLALATADRRLAMSGVTTELHAIFFANYDRKERRLEDAPGRVADIREFDRHGVGLVKHDVLFRADLWSLESIDQVLRSSAGAERPVISLNDHTPGQGQYRDAAGLRRYLEEVVGQSPEEAERNIKREIERARDEPAIALQVLDRVATLARERDIVLISHDDDSAERVDQMYAAGARVGEFPVNSEAARRQRELDMTIVMGAPNVVRGGSSSGNVSAASLIAQGLVDALCADYFSPALLYAVKALVDGGICSWPDAVRLVTLNPARALGRQNEIGSIEPGKQADLAVVNFGSTAPAVSLLLRHGQLCYEARVGRPGNVPAATGSGLTPASIGHER